MMNNLKKLLLLFFALTLILACGGGGTEASTSETIERDGIVYSYSYSYSEQATETPRPTLDFCNPNEVNSTTDYWLINQYKDHLTTTDFTGVLARQVQSWSDYRDYEDVRYTFTYMSPELIQIALLGLAQERNLSQTELESLSNRIMSQLLNSEELVFLLTITSSKNDSIRAIDVPDFSIVNTYGEEAYPIRWDRLFDAQMDMNRRVQFGFIMFPAGYYKEDSCIHTINFERDTSILIRSNTYNLGKSTWSINTSPIGRMIAEAIPTREPAQQNQDSNTSQTVIYQIVPTPQINTTPDFSYWLDFAGFVMGVIGLFL